MTETRDRPPTQPPDDGWLDRQRFTRVAEECGWSLAELARFYLGGTADQLHGIREALSAGNAEEVMRRAHGCVGSSGTCGIDGMTEVFRALEQAGLDGRLEAAEELARRAESRLAEVSAALTRLAAG